MKVAVWAPLTVCALASCLLPGERQAAACGGFFSSSMVAQGRTPSLSYEQTLIAFDPDKGHEEFVREVVFRGSTEPFGFVVPTPSQPHVSSLSSPFEKLQREFPFQVERRLAAAAAAPRGGGGMAKAAAPMVQVLEERKVGSFKAFVLAANDSAALAGWLSQNGFVTVKASQDWLGHYVKLKFFYVAMRYEPKGAQDGKTTAETIRISFDTPLPYYPYLEPDLPRVNDDGRMLELWLLSQRRFVPVALEQRAAAARWVQPLATGIDYSATNTADNDRLRASLAVALGAEGAVALLPGRPGGAYVTLQRFADQKQSRAQFGDIVFVPAEKTPADAKATAALGRMARLLDPSLTEEEP